MKQSSILSAKFDCPVARQNLSLLATGLLNGMRSRWWGWGGGGAPSKHKHVEIGSAADIHESSFCHFCSCSQQEAYEEPDQRNGLYANHLLRHIRRDTRIEVILMDVARGKKIHLIYWAQRHLHHQLSASSSSSPLPTSSSSSS